MKKYLKFKEIDGGIKLCKVDGYSKKQRKKINKMCLSLELNLEDMYFILYSINNKQKKKIRKIKYVSYKKLKESPLFKKNIIAIDIGYGNIPQLEKKVNKASKYMRLVGKPYIDMGRSSIVPDMDIVGFMNQFREAFKKTNNKVFVIDEAHRFHSSCCVNKKETNKNIEVKKEDVMRIKRERAAKVQEMNKKRHPGFKK